MYLPRDSGGDAKVSFVKICTGSIQSRFPDPSFLAKLRVATIGHNLATVLKRLPWI